MRDALFGVLGNISAATKATDVYSANYVDLGSISSVSRFTRHTFHPNLSAVFQATADLAAADSFTPFLYSDSDSGFATNNYKAIIGETTGTGALSTSQYRIKVPETSLRYIEAGVTPNSSGTFTAKTIVAWFEVGAGTNIQT